MGKSRLVAVIDDADCELVRGYAWYPSPHGSTFYARAGIKRGRFGRKRGVRNPQKEVYMHDLLMPKIEGFEIDHSDGDGLNNRRSNNLRYATHQENCRNRVKHKVGQSSYKGVGWHKQHNKWRAYIRDDIGKDHHLGLFDSEIDAAKVYDMAAKQYHGEYACLNFKVI